MVGIILIRLHHVSDTIRDTDPMPERYDERGRKDMIRFHKPRIALFWQFFAKYFVLFLIPVIVAITFTYIFVVRLIEDDAKQRNDIIMHTNSEHVDAAFNTVQAAMIRLLSDANLKSLLHVANDTAYNQQRNEWMHSIMGQLGRTLVVDELVSGAYLYMANHDLVVDFELYSDRHYFFQYKHPLDKSSRQAILPHLTGKKTMFLTKPYSIGVSPLSTDPSALSRSVISAVMSYPFNSATPDVYLVVDINLDVLREKIRSSADWVVGTAIVDNDGDTIVRTGSMELAAAGSGDGKASSFVHSTFNDTLRYASVVDIQKLLQPARMIRMLSLAFLGFFLILGSGVSYYLSRKLYAPILEIKTGLATYREPGAPVRREGNDFDVIKRFSGMLISENSQLSKLVSGMGPFAQEHFVTKLLLGEYRDEQTVAASAAEIDFAHNRQADRTVLCIEFQYYSRAREGQTETSKSYLLAELKETIVGEFAGETIWLSHTKPDILACVLHRGREAGFGPREAANAIKRILERYAPYYKATIGVGHTVQTIGELHLSYEHAMSMLRFKGMLPEVEVFGEEPVRSDNAAWDSFLSVQEVNRIFNQCKSREFDGMLQSVLELLEAGKNARASEMKYLCSDVLNTWIRATERERTDFSIAFYSRLFDMLSRCVTVDEIKQAFRDIRALLFRGDEHHDRTRPFAEILAYIHGHYAEDLSIEQFAQQMNMSVGHFSRTFKEEVGEKYVEYIAKVRMSRAKQYLLETDLKIDEIAEKVGYWGRNSFIPIFRKYEGITPAKYRTIYGSAT